MPFIDRLIEWTGKTISWLSLLLVLVIVVVSLFRYFFSITAAASFEIEWHLFGALFLVAAAYTWQKDKHVRVDVFYNHFSAKTKAWINLIGTCLLLMPFAFVTFYESLSFVATSFNILERSPDPGGLPFRFMIKAMIPVGFFLLMLAGVSSVLKSIKQLRGND